MFYGLNQFLIFSVLLYQRDRWSHKFYGSPLPNNWPQCSEKKKKKRGNENEAKELLPVGKKKMVEKYKQGDGTSLTAVFF